MGWLREQLCAEIEKAQGERGYVLFAREGCDRCYAVTYCPDENAEINVLYEECLNAVKVQDGKLFIHCCPDTSDKSHEWMQDHGNWWMNVDEPHICTDYTLLTIAENLQDYV